MKSNGQHQALQNEVEVGVMTKPQVNDLLVCVMPYLKEVGTPRPPAIVSFSLAQVCCDREYDNKVLDIDVDLNQPPASKAPKTPNTPDSGRTPPLSPKGPLTPPVSMDKVFLEVAPFPLLPFPLWPHFLT